MQLQQAQPQTFLLQADGSLACFNEQPQQQQVFLSVQAAPAEGEVLLPTQPLPQQQQVPLATTMITSLDTLAHAATSLYLPAEQEAEPKKGGEKLMILGKLIVTVLNTYFSSFSPSQVQRVWLLLVF